MPRASTQPFVQATILSILSTLTMLSMLAAPSTATAQEAWHAVQEQHAMDLLRSLPTARAGYRTPQEIAGLQKTEELVLEHLRTLGYQPQTQDVPRPERIATLTPEEAPTPRNIWVDLPGEGDRAGELLVMMAHIDSVVGSPGADDNATGVVALLERGVAAVFDCVGYPDTIDLALHLLRPGGTLVLVGAARQQPVDWSLVWNRELTVRGTINGGPEPALGGRRSAEQAVEWLQDPAFPVDAVVTHLAPLDRWQDAMATASAGPRARAGKVALRPDPDLPLVGAVRARQPRR